MSSDKLSGTSKKKKGLPGQRECEGLNSGYWLSSESVKLEMSTQLSCPGAASAVFFLFLTSSFLNILSYSPLRSSHLLRQTLQQSGQLVMKKFLHFQSIELFLPTLFNLSDSGDWRGFVVLNVNLFYTGLMLPTNYKRLPVWHEMHRH